MGPKLTVWGRNEMEDVWAPVSENKQGGEEEMMSFLKR